MKIPIIVLCYNNYKYVSLMLMQLTSLLLTPNITVLDNGSTDPYTVSYLSGLSNTNVKVIRNTYYQCGNAWENIYDQLPDVFAVTDADLLFGENMSYNFLNDLLTISTKARSGQVTLALKITDSSLMYDYSFSDFGYQNVGNIQDSQLPYWLVKYTDHKYTLYREPAYDAPSNSLFSLYNKKRIKNWIPQNPVRIAGNYQVQVLSWYKDIVSIYKDSPISRLHRYFASYLSHDYYPIKYFELQYLKDNNIVPISKTTSHNKVITHLVQLEKTNRDDFWQTTYPSAYNPIFNLFDQYLDPEKDYIDIGSWYGDTLFYPSRKSKRVIALEPDPRVLVTLSYLVRMTFLDTPIILERSGLFYATTSSSAYLNLGDLAYPATDTFIRSTNPQSGDVQITTITFSALVDKYQISAVSFINMNINGAEEGVLQDMYDYSSLNTVPLYVTFYYSRWADPNIDRFLFLTADQKTAIVSGIVSILFNG